MQKTSHANSPGGQELPELFSYIDNRKVVPARDRGSDLRDPNTRKAIQPQRSSSPEQVEAAIAAADRAYQTGEWENVDVEERATMLDRIADSLDQTDVIERVAVTDSLTTGAVIQVTRRMARLAPLSYRAAADFLRSGELDQTMPGKQGDVTCLRRPWGPALLISPWNGPTVISAHKIASALAAGAPCIMKPSEWAPHSALVMAEHIANCDLPDGSFQLICGSREVGSLMLGDPRIKAVSFTGGTVGGRAIAHACADNFTPTQLELGGNNPLVVFADADLDLAAEGIVYGLSNLNAQWCRALGRLVVHRSVKEALLERVAERLEKLKLGHSLDEGSEMGPLIHQGQYDSVLAAIEQLEAAGGNALSYTSLPDLPGYFVAPTLVDGCDPATTREEIFGPVAAIHSFDTDAEALDLANGTDYGLAAYVYSASDERARAFSLKLRAGGVKINGYSLLSLSPQAPRSAWGLSGLGEEGTRETVQFFTGARVIGYSPQDRILT